MLRHDQLPPIPETPRPLPDGPLYFVGIGGAGMSSIAQVLAEKGRQIAGADPGISDVVRARLEKVGIRVYKTHDAAQLEDAAVVVVSDAIPENNPEVGAARERGLPIFRRPEVLGAIVNAGRGIAIAGTHGKTTTTGMVASILLAAGLDPTIILGGDLPAIGGNARTGKGDIVLAESCEAYDGFLYLHPTVAVVLNVEADHLDYHGDEDHVIASFERFLNQVDADKGAIIVNGDDDLTWAVTDSLPIRNAKSAKQMGRGVYSRHEALNLRYYTLNGDMGPVPLSAVDIDESGGNPSFAIRSLQRGISWGHASPGSHADRRYGTSRRITMKVPGRHNIGNALAAAGAAIAVGLTLEDVADGLEAFTGTGRRFERIGEAKGVSIVDDYAHHPTELRATLSAARSAYPDKRIVAVFQPHLPSRTRDNMDAFAEALTLADAVYLTDIYLAREQPLEGISSAVLAERTQAAKPGLTVTYVPDKIDLPARLAADVQAGDIVLTLGAGDIRAAGERLLKELGQ